MVLYVRISLSVVQCMTNYWVMHDLYFIYKHLPRVLLSTLGLEVICKVYQFMLSDFDK